MDAMLSQVQLEEKGDSRLRRGGRALGDRQVKKPLTLTLALALTLTLTLGTHSRGF